MEAWYSAVPTTRLEPYPRSVPGIVLEPGSSMTYVSTGHCIASALDRILSYHNLVPATAAVSAGHGIDSA
eukprot:1645375-Rhodomonas_salina.1